MKYLITGAHGLLGTEIMRLDNTISAPKRNVLDLVNQRDVNEYFKRNHNKFDSVIHLAAKVGGVKANTDYVADFFRDNTQMNINIVDACHKYDKKLVTILSTCIYPARKYINYPLTEEQLHYGPPHESNFGYSYAKRMLDVMTRAYRQQYQSKFITAIPNNLYGLNDNYNITSGHVIPSLIRKFYEAKISNKKEVVVWGSGMPQREFTFARDAAKIIMWLANNYSGDTPVNIGNTSQITIKDLAYMICDAVNYNGKIIFDKTMPDGQIKKPSSNGKLVNINCPIKYTPLVDGIKETVQHFEQKYPVLRGVKND